MSLRYARITPLDDEGLDTFIPNDYWWPIDLEQLNADHGVNLEEQTEEYLTENFFYRVNNGPLPTKNEDGNNKIKLSNYIHYDEEQGHHTKWIFSDFDMEDDLPMTDEEIQIANEFNSD